jgi:lipocalin
MANPFGISFNIIGYLAASFASALTKGTDEGKVVKISANDTVALCDQTDQFHGVVKVIDAADKVATVQVKGFVTVSYSGTAPSVGYATLEADDAGGVQIVGTPALGDRFYLIVNVDTTNTKATFLLA